MLEVVFLFQNFTMEFSQKLYQAAKPIINDIYEDDFIQKMLSGDIGADALRHYLKAMLRI